MPFFSVISSRLNMFWFPSSLYPMCAKVKGVDGTAWQDLERPAHAFAVVELNASFLVEMFKPGGVHEVGNQDPLNLVTKFVRFARVADFVGVQKAPVSFVLNEEVTARVRQHFQQFVAEGDRPFTINLLIAAREHLSQWQAFGGQVVVAQVIRLVPIIEDPNPPRVMAGLSLLG
jgi:hypothetical protein